MINSQKSCETGHVPFSPGRVKAEVADFLATVRHRTIRSKDCLSNGTALELVEGAQKSWHRLDGHNQLPILTRGDIRRWDRGHRQADRPSAR